MIEYLIHLLIPTAYAQTVLSSTTLDGLVTTTRNEAFAGLWTILGVIFSAALTIALVMMAFRWIRGFTRHPR